MRRILLALLIALGALVPASAQTTTGIAPCILSTSASVGCTGQNGVIAMVQNNTLVAQSVTVTCTWPNGSLEIAAPGATQIITVSPGPYPGVPFQGPLTCTPSGAPTGIVNTGDGIIIWWAKR